MPQFIGINARKGSGKTTAANILINDFDFKVVKMADTLKNMVRLLLTDLGKAPDEIERLVEGTQEQKEAPLRELNGKSCRNVMETLGTEWRDMIDSELWVKIAAKKIKLLLDSGHNVVCDDIRFDHEVDLLLNEIPQAKFVKIERDSLKFDESKLHASERGITSDYIDFLLKNNGSISELEDQIRDLIINSIKAAA